MLPTSPKDVSPTELVFRSINGSKLKLIDKNHTSWTRQDKIFAMLKFKERSVVASSYAFILTIKVVNLKQNSDNTISQDHSLIYQNENSNNTHKSENKIEQENEKCLLHSSKIDNPKTNKQCDNVQILKYENKSIQLNNNNMKTNFKELSLSEESTKQPLNNNEDKFKFCKDTNIFKVHMSPKDSKALNDKMEQSNVNCVQNQDIRHQLSDYRIDINKYNIEKGKTNSISNSNKMLNGNSVIDDANTDSVNLPYQYLIEKEIENAKQNTLGEVNKKDTTTNTEITEIEDPSCSKKKKDTLEVSRSSDITDLVMEGLMFTIRQGQDAITVIEQKTKLEIDEVLENSEKIETEEGEKCLRNSSLLGLENIVRMIELPKRNEFKSEHQNVISQKSTLGNQSMNKSLFNNVKHLLTNNEIKEKNFTSGLKYSFNSISASTSYTNNNNSLSITNKRRYSDIHDKCGKHIKVVKNKYLKYEGEEKKDDDNGDKEIESEDIVPEALQNETFLFPESLESKDELKSMPDKDLLMQDIDNEDLTKFEIGKNELKPNFNNSLHFKRYSRSSNHNSISTKFFTDKAQKLHKDTICESKFNAKKYKSNAPVIISNQIITLNEMPLSLQKILRNKLSTKQHNPLNDKNMINKDNIEVCKTQACQNENNASNAQLGNQISDNILTSRDDERPIQDNRKTCNESTLNTEEKCSSTSSQEVTKLTEEESQKQDDCIDKPELSSTKIKNITQEFYKNCSYLKKENLTNQKYLRSRRKLLDYTNNSEMHIQMLKFFQDITRGAKVVVTRINVNKYS
ncbi:hypothetical protein WN51_10421 [Melipona quadrifasciata]|uniref:Uncharacterized protein n=1 Tax=Melipona quadrifasciata TaxID=166423 RepID=A0A0M9A4G0_9HYME|nr:hypothetical protein WN51_10421 [Melipona quadrifasciata]